MKKLSLKLCGLFLAALLLLGGSLLPTAAGHPFPEKVIPGGMPFGVKFATDGLPVVGFCDVDGETGRSNPAREAGIQIKDIITAVNGRPVTGAEDLMQAVESSGGHPLTLTVRRMDKGTSPGRRTHTERQIPVTPCRSGSEHRYKTGLWIRDSGAGIGTVTFVLPDSRLFGGLGHGICDGDTGELIPMRRGQIADVTISGINRGEAGSPGALKGYFHPRKTGVLSRNTESGVFGVLDTVPGGAMSPIQVGSKQDLTPGKATILCTLDDGEIGRYAVMITSVDYHATGSKCFTLTVTDPDLLRKTGGIVQGMSGSPVIQNGRLVGAVTHVLINNPTSGYGIFLDHMLRELPSVST